jgi:membrane-bound lytic murein transglycosylase D
VVRAGKHDSVASIARRYKLSPAQVAQWNDVGNGASFKPGQKVVLHLPVRGTRRAAVRVRKGVKQVSTKPAKAAPKRAPARRR